VEALKDAGGQALTQRYWFRNAAFDICSCRRSVESVGHSVRVEATVA
jgi:hypothetical protein